MNKNIINLSIFLIVVGGMGAIISFAMLTYPPEATTNKTNAETKISNQSMDVVYRDGFYTITRYTLEDGVVCYSTGMRGDFSCLKK